MKKTLALCFLVVFLSGCAGSLVNMGLMSPVPSISPPNLYDSRARASVELYDKKVYYGGVQVDWGRITNFNIVSWPGYVLLGVTGMPLSLIIDTLTLPFCDTYDNRVKQELERKRAEEQAREP